MKDEIKKKAKSLFSFKKYIIIGSGVLITIVLLMFFSLFAISTEGAVYTYYAFEKVLGSDEKQSYTIEELNESNTVCKFNSDWYLLPYEDVTQLEKISFNFRLDIDDKREIEEISVILMFGDLAGEMLASQNFKKENGEKITNQDSFFVELDAGQEITLRRSNAWMLTVDIFVDDGKPVANIIWSIEVG